MKARIRKTGEVVDIISFSGDTFRSNNDWVSYINSEGRECPQMGLNRYWDFEGIDSILSTTSPDWEQRRYELAKAAMNGLLGCCSYYKDDVNRMLYAERSDDTQLVKQSVDIADEMIKQLKEIANHQ